MTRVQVHRGLRFDPAIVASALGEQPLLEPLTSRVLAPVITVDGRIHGPSTAFLQRHCRGNASQGTATRIAHECKAWLDHLIVHRGHVIAPGRPDPLASATEDDFHTYYMRRQYGDDSTTLTSESWEKAKSAIKRLHEHLERQHGVPPPFDIVTFRHRDGWSGTRIAGYQQRRKRVTSAGKPLEPAFADLLLMGALCVGLDGVQRDQITADRDAAIIGLALATGMRRLTLANITVYELPSAARAHAGLTVTRVPSAIVKGGGGGEALTFAHRLSHVEVYVQARTDQIETARPFAPVDPLQIIRADSRTCTFRDPNSQADHTILWNDADVTLRRRLVDTDGCSSPILFLRTGRTASPLSYDSFQEPVERATAFAREHLEKDFPSARLHDLRHTYAVHLTLAIFHGLVSRAVHSASSDSYLVDRVIEAVELVKESLGHVSEQSTKLYAATAYRFLAIDPAQFIGEE